MGLKFRAIMAADAWIMRPFVSKVNYFRSVFHALVLLLIIDFVITVDPQSTLAMLYEIHCH